jgi:hypothetical protein
MIGELSRKASLRIAPAATQLFGLLIAPYQRSLSAS